MLEEYFSDRWEVLVLEPFYTAYLRQQHAVGEKEHLGDQFSIKKGEGNAAVNGLCSSSLLHHSVARKGRDHVGTKEDADMGEDGVLLHPSRTMLFRDTPLPHAADSSCPRHHQTKVAAAERVPPASAHTLVTGSHFDSHSPPARQVTGYKQVSRVLYHIVRRCVHDEWCYQSDLRVVEHTPRIAQLDRVLQQLDQVQRQAAESTAAQEDVSLFCSSSSLRSEVREIEFLRRRQHQLEEEAGGAHAIDEIRKFLCQAQAQRDTPLQRYPVVGKARCQPSVNVSLADNKARETLGGLAEGESVEAPAGVQTHCRGPALTPEQRRQLHTLVKDSVRYAGVLASLAEVNRQKRLAEPDAMLGPPSLMCGRPLAGEIGTPVRGQPSATALRTLGLAPHGARYGDPAQVLYLKYPPPLIQESAFTLETMRLYTWLQSWLSRSPGSASRRVLNDNRKTAASRAERGDRRHVSVEEGGKTATKPRGPVEKETTRRGCHHQPQHGVSNNTPRSRGTNNNPSFIHSSSSCSSSSSSSRPFLSRITKKGNNKGGRNKTRIGRKKRCAEEGVSMQRRDPVVVDSNSSSCSDVSIKEAEGDAYFTGDDVEKISHHTTSSSSVTGPLPRSNESMLQALRVRRRRPLPLQWWSPLLSYEKRWRRLWRDRIQVLPTRNDGCVSPSSAPAAVPALDGVECRFRSSRLAEKEAVLAALVARREAKREARRSAMCGYFPLWITWKPLEGSRRREHLRRPKKRALDEEKACEKTKNISIETEKKKRDTTRSTRISGINTAHNILSSSSPVLPALFPFSAPAIVDQESERDGEGIAQLQSCSGRQRRKRSDTATISFSKDKESNNVWDDRDSSDSCSSAVLSASSLSHSSDMTCGSDTLSSHHSLVCSSSMSTSSSGEDVPPETATKSKAHHSRRRSRAAARTEEEDDGQTPYLTLPLPHQKEEITTEKSAAVRQGICEVETTFHRRLMKKEGSLHDRKRGRQWSCDSCISSLSEFSTTISLSNNSSQQTHHRQPLSSQPPLSSEPKAISTTSSSSDSDADGEEESTSALTTASSALSIEASHAFRSPVTNLAVIAGACGSGKTAAVYLAASLLQCRVVEINTAALRTPKTLSTLIAELTKSRQHLVQWKETANTIRSRGNGGGAVGGGGIIQEELERMKRELDEQTKAREEENAKKQRTVSMSNASNRNSKKNAISPSAITSFFSPKPVAAGAVASEKATSKSPTAEEVKVERHHCTQNAEENRCTEGRSGSITSFFEPRRGTKKICDEGVPPLLTQHTVGNKDDGGNEKDSINNNNSNLQQMKTSSTSGHPKVLSPTTTTAATTVLLVEDGDLLLGSSEAHQGKAFYAALRDMAEQSHVPIVMTVNYDNNKATGLDCPPSRTVLHPRSCEGSAAFMSDAAAYPESVEWLVAAVESPPSQRTRRIGELEAVVRSEVGLHSLLMYAHVFASPTSQVCSLPCRCGVACSSCQNSVSHERDISRKMLSTTPLLLTSTCIPHSPLYDDYGLAKGEEVDVVDDGNDACNYPTLSSASTTNCMVKHSNSSTSTAVPDVRRKRSDASGNSHSLVADFFSPVTAASPSSAGGGSPSVLEPTPLSTGRGGVHLLFQGTSPASSTSACASPATAWPISNSNTNNSNNASTLTTQSLLTSTHFTPAAVAQQFGHATPTISMSALSRLSVYVTLLAIGAVETGLILYRVRKVRVKSKRRFGSTREDGLAAPHPTGRRGGLHPPQSVARCTAADGVDGIWPHRSGTKRRRSATGRNAATRTAAASPSSRREYLVFRRFLTIPNLEALWDFSCFLERLVFGMDPALLKSNTLPLSLSYTNSIQCGSVCQKDLASLKSPPPGRGRALLSLAALMRYKQHCRWTTDIRYWINQLHVYIKSVSVQGVADPAVPPLTPQDLTDATAGDDDGEVPHDEVTTDKVSSGQLPDLLHAACKVVEEVSWCDYTLGVYLALRRCEEEVRHWTRVLRNVSSSPQLTAAQAWLWEHAYEGGDGGGEEEVHSCIGSSTMMHELHKEDVYRISLARLHYLNDTLPLQEKKKTEKTGGGHGAGAYCEDKSVKGSTLYCGGTPAPSPLPSDLSNHILLDPASYFSFLPSAVSAHECITPRDGRGGSALMLPCGPRQRRLLSWISSLKPASALNRGHATTTVAPKDHGEGIREDLEGERTFLPPLPMFGTATTSQSLPSSGDSTAPPLAVPLAAVPSHSCLLRRDVLDDVGTCDVFPRLERYRQIAGGEVGRRLSEHTKGDRNVVLWSSADPNSNNNNNNNSTGGDHKTKGGERELVEEWKKIGARSGIKVCEAARDRSGAARRNGRHTYAVKDSTNSRSRHTVTLIMHDRSTYED